MAKKNAEKGKPKSASLKSQPNSENSTAMKTSEIRDLIDFISQSGLNEVDIETKELKLHVKREPDQKVFKASAAPVVAAPVAAAPVATAPVATVPKAEKAAPAGKKTVDIKSPMIGNVLPFSQSRLTCLCFRWR